MRLTFPLIALALAASAPRTEAQCEVAKLLPPTPSLWGFLGAWVSADDGTLVAGANGFLAGSGRSAVVFERIAGIWQEVDQLAIAGGSTAFATPVAIDDDTIMLGDIDDSQGAGAVHVFERIGGSWTFTQLLGASVGIADAHFGRRIVIDGDRAAISAPMDAQTQYRGGAVYIFERIGGSWTEVQRLTAAPAHHFGFYGLGLALEGDILAVGEPYYEFPDQNLIYVYRDGPTGWTLETTIAGVGTQFGRALTLENGMLAAGDFGDTGAVGPSVRVFDEAAGWQQTGIVTASDVGASHSFGATILLHQGRLIVGSGDPEIHAGQGVHVFLRAGQRWELEGPLVPLGGPLSTGGFGSALAADGDDLFVGAPGDGETVEEAGAVFAFEPCGTRFCLGAVNSTGEAASIQGMGSPRIMANTFTLAVTHAPPSTTGLFCYGSTRIQVPLGNGFRCTGGALHRLNPPAPSDVLGESSRALDFESPPASSGPGMILPGSTWHFQYWYRDPDGQGARFNLSDGWTTTFLP